MQTSNRDLEARNTKAYWVLPLDKEGNRHRVLAYEVDQITAPLERVDIRPALEFFPGVLEDEIARPIGQWICFWEYRVPIFILCVLQWLGS